MSVHSLELTKSGIVGALTFKSVPVLADFIEAHPNFKAAIYRHLPPFASMPMNKITDVIPEVEKRLEWERARNRDGSHHYEFNRHMTLSRLLDAMREYDRRIA